jgi:hypothetical protein
MAKRSLRNLLRRKRPDKKALSPEMRTLLDSFEAQYGHPGQHKASRSSLKSHNSDNSAPPS